MLTVYILRYEAIENSCNEVEFFKDSLESDDYQDFFHILDSLKTPEEKFAGIWCMSFVKVQPHLINKDKTLPVFYENLVLNPEKELTRIFQFLNKNMPDKIVTRASIPSHTTVKGSPILKGGNQLNGWKKYLSEKQINDILNTVSKFGIEMYSHSTIPA